MSESTDFETREQWLVAFTAALRPRFAAAGHPLPANVRLACGWPRTAGGGIRHAVLFGATWFNAEDGIAQVFISPILSNPVAVASTLIHELCHAEAGADAKHGRPFQDVARAVGLGKPWSTTPPTDNLLEVLGYMIADLGAYPHVALAEPKPRASTPSVKLECATCDYVVRVAQPMLERGLPLCPDGDLLQP